jgi:membrane-bound lytic murein transglycosylase B
MKMRLIINLLLPKRFTLGAAAILYALLLSAPSGFCAAEADNPTMKFVSPKHKELIKELIQQHGFSAQFLTPLFQDVFILQDILEKFDRPPERRLRYFEYRKLFLSDAFIAGGHLYFEKNWPLLDEVQARYGVPKEIIAAILGIETRFGQPGIEPYRAWDVLNTAYALYSRREAFYKGELIAFLKLCREEGIDPLSVRSSYAGAIGVPQFMPSSFLKYAVDHDGDKKRNLWSSNGDIYASVANYLKEAGWKKDGPILLPVKISGNLIDIQKVVDAGIKEVIPAEAAMNMGIDMPISVRPDEPVSFVSYDPQDGHSLFVSLFDNFRAITRYNISVNYALVVTELSEILARGKNRPSEKALPDVKPDVQPDVKPDAQNEQGPNLIPPVRPS